MFKVSLVQAAQVPQGVGKVLTLVGAPVRFRAAGEASWRLDTYETAKQLKFMYRSSLHNGTYLP